jgi:hypothetical protein
MSDNPKMLTAKLQQLKAECASVTAELDLLVAEMTATRNAEEQDALQDRILVLMNRQRDAENRMRAAELAFTDAQFSGPLK